MALLSKANRLYDEYKLELRHFLEERGWKYTSNNPASLWLYEKKLKDGRTVLADEGTAVSFEEHR